MTLDATTTEINELIADLEALKAFHEDNPDLPIGLIYGRTMTVEVPYVVREDGSSDYEQIDLPEAARRVRAMKPVEKEGNDGYMTYTRHVGTKAKVVLTLNRNAVCEKRVVTTTAIYHPAVPAHTETVHTYEWDCGPILDKVED